MTRTGRGRSSVLLWSMAVVIILGVLGMHALTAPGQSATTGGGGSASVMSHDTAAPTPADQCPSCGSPVDDHQTPAGGHSMLTLCLAVLGGLTSLLLLVAVLLRWSDPVAAAAAPRRRGLARSAARPPPWTVPSLHQLSLLRV